MKIGIFGDSSASWRESNNWGYPSYCEIVRDHFSSDTISWHGANTGSLQRTIKNLTRHKNLDLYIIFHSAPDYIYCPGWKRDFSLDEIKQAASDRSRLDWFEKTLKTHGSHCDDLKIKLKSWVEIWNDEKIMQLNFIAGLQLFNKILQNKTVLHIPRSKVEKEIIRVGTFNDTLRTYVKVAGTHPTYLEKEQHVKVAKELISIIGSYKLL